MYHDFIFDLYGTLVDILTNEDKPILWETLVREYDLPGIGKTAVDKMELYTEDRLGNTEENTPGSIPLPETRAECLRRIYNILVSRETERMRKMVGGNPVYDPEISLEKVFALLLDMDLEKEGAKELIQKFGHRFRELSMEYISLYPGAITFLQKLREAGGSVWLLSNAQRVFTEYELDRLGLMPYFDGIYLSSDYGCKKPDPAFFNTLLRERAIDPQTAVMIGNDSLCDIGGAKHVGLGTVYFHTATSPKEIFCEADMMFQGTKYEEAFRLLMD